MNAEAEKWIAEFTNAGAPYSIHHYIREAMRWAYADAESEARKQLWAGHKWAGSPEEDSAVIRRICEAIKERTV